MTPEQFFKDIQHHHKEGLPFVIYRKPDTDHIEAMLQTDDVIHKAEDFTENGFVFAPFDDREDAILIPNNNSTSIRISNVKSSTVENFSLKFTENRAAKLNYIALIKNARESLSSGPFKKVVLSRKEKVPLGKADPIMIFRRLLNNYRSAFVYCWFHPKIGLWLGATPETLLRINQNMLSTMALAGTLPFRGSLDVSWGEKEKEEQKIVTDYIESKLQTFAEAVDLSKTQTVKAGILLHLQTIITAQLKEGFNNFGDILSTLHPTPAVCGYPKAEALRYIMDNEGYNREFYTGYLGELGPDYTELYVNLRCMQLKERQVLLYIGGGITEDSIPENEWQETVHKAKIMKSVL